MVVALAALAALFEIVVCANARRLTVEERLVQRLLPPALPAYTSRKQPRLHAWPRLPCAKEAARARAPAMRAPEFLFRLSWDRQELEFGAKQQTLNMVRPEPAGSLQEFIEEEGCSALVLSSFPPKDVARVEGVEDEFLIRAEEFDFITLRIAVELRVRCSFDPSTTTVLLESLGFTFIGPGLEDLAKSIDIKVKGKLRPTAPDARICALTGEVSFVAKGELPVLLRPVPDPALIAATRAVSEAIIAAAAERFSQQVPQAYSRWAAKRR